MEITAIAQNNHILVEYAVKYENIILLYVITFNENKQILSLQIVNKLQPQEWTACFTDCFYDTKLYIEAFRSKDWKYIHDHSNTQLNSTLTDQSLDKLYSDTIPSTGGFVSLLS